MRYLILLVDDEPHSTASLMKVLKSSRFDIITASNLSQATLMLERYLPHALVVDVGMGARGANGLQWIESLQGGPFSKLPAIIMTSSHSPRTVAHAMSLNVVDYIIKPSNYPTLLRKINRICRLLDQSSNYSRQLKPDEAIFASILFQNTISAIGESEIRTEGSFRWMNPPFDPGRAVWHRTPFFREMNLEEPLLRFSFSESGQGSFCNHLSMHEVPEEDSRRLRRWVWQQKLRPLNPNRIFGEEPLFDISFMRYPISFRESARILEISETQLKLSLPLEIIPNSRCQLLFGQRTLPIICKEASRSPDGEIQMNALIEPETPQEVLSDVRRAGL